MRARLLILFALALTALAPLRAAQAQAVSPVYNPVQSAVVSPVGGGGGYDPRWVVFDFAQGVYQDGQGHYASGDPRGLSAFSYSRAGGTFAADASDRVTSYVSNAPPVTNLGMQVYEGIGANLIGKSEAFDGAGWASTALTVTPNTTVDPVGHQTADTLTTSVDASVHYTAYSNVPVVSGTTYTGSVVAKAGTDNLLQVTLNNASGSFSGQGYVNVDLSTCTAAATGGTFVSYRLTRLAGGWCRAAITGVATANSSSSGISLIRINSPTATRAPAYTGTGSTVHVWCAQMEARAFETPCSLTGWNLLTYSEQFDNAAWVKNAGAVTANSAVAPDGTTTADTFTDNTTTSNRSVQHPFSSVSGSTYTGGVFAKAGTARYLQALFNNAGFGLGAWGNFDLQSCTATGTKGAGATLQSSWSAGGWCRISVTATATQTASSGINIVSISVPDAPRGPTYLGLGATRYLWGGFLVPGSDPGPYDPVTTVSVPRGAATAVLSTSTLPASVYAEFKLGATVSGNQYIAQWDDGTNNNRAVLFTNSGTSLSVVVTTGGVGQINLVLCSSCMSVGSLNRVALRFSASGVAGSVNGIAVAGSGAVTLPTISRMVVGGPSNPLQGTVLKLVGSPSSWSDAQLQAISGSGGPLGANDNDRLPAALRRAYGLDLEAAA